MEEITVIGLSGKIGSGKTTVADALVREYKGIGDGSIRVLMRNFADRLKEEVAMHLEIDLSWCYSHDGKNLRLGSYDMTLGEMLQQWGTRLRGLHQDIWVIAVQSWMEARVLERKTDERLLIIIGDVRFPNEVEWIHRIGGKVIRLEGDPAGERARSKRDLQHISETALDACETFDLVIDTNDNNQEETAKKAIAFVKAALP